MIQNDDEKTEKRGLVFDIQRFSIHDGPGIRTTVFLQGCNLRCYWCHNPESQSLRPQVQFFPDKCIGCGACVVACPNNAQLLLERQRIFVRDLCQACGRCAEACFARALVVKARLLSVAQVMAELEQDRDYYRASGGGVTFSGGEPLVQPEFLRALLAESKERDLHTAVDTAANVPWHVLAGILSTTDLFLLDIKAVDEERHVRGTGAGNRQILANVRRLAENGARIWIRVPVVPGFNDDFGELARIADFIAGLKGVELVELLPFHHLGAGKYDSLGMEYPCRGLAAPEAEAMERFRLIFRERGLPVAEGAQARQKVSET